MADENNNSTDNSEKDSANYVRKKNLISGIDNDHLIIGMLGLLGAAVAAPHVKAMLDGVIRNMQHPQPPNGVQQQIVPPSQLPVIQPQVQPQVHPQQKPEHNLLRQYEANQREQDEYKALQEKEMATGSQSISMVPERQKNQKDKGVFEAGSTISAG